MTATPALHVEDHAVAHPGGRLFARSWTPAIEAAAAPLVLLHDSLGSVELWRDFPAQLSHATGRRVIAYDRLGFGRSDARHDSLPLDFIAEEARTVFPLVLRQLGVQRFVALGHSVGGGMAVHCAAAWAADCEALITVSAQAFVEDRTVQGLQRARQQFQDTAQLERLARYHGAQAAWVLNAWLGTWLNPAFAHWSLANVLPRVRCPVLAIHGADDEYGSARHPQLIAERATGPVRVELMSGVGHMPHREQPGQVLARVAAWLSATGRDHTPPA